MDNEITTMMMSVAEATAIRGADCLRRGGDLQARDEAIKTMFTQLEHLPFECTVVLGEGEPGSVKFLVHGQRVGKCTSQRFDLLARPFYRRGLNDESLSLLVVSMSGTILPVPDVAMEFLAIGPEAYYAVDLDRPLPENLHSVASALGEAVAEVEVAVIDDPKNLKFIEGVLIAGARLQLVHEGEYAVAAKTVAGKLSPDLFLGHASATDAVLLSAVWRPSGGGMQCRFAPASHRDWERCQEYGFYDPLKVLTLSDLVGRSDLMVIGTGVTNGTLLEGVDFVGENVALTQSMVVTAAGLGLFRRKHGRINQAV